MDTDVQFGKTETVLEIDGGDGYTTMRMYCMPQNSTLKNGENGVFYVMYILWQQKQYQCNHF